MSETTTIISGEQLQTALHAQLTDEVYLKLVSHTIHRLRYRYGLRESGVSLKQKAHEFLQQVLSLVFVEQTRKWNIDMYSDLQSFLRSVIDSHLYNTITARRVVSLENEDGVFEERSGVQSNAQEDIAATELRTQITRILEEEGADDEELLVFECLFDGFRTPRSIREELGISEESFGSIWRRIQRKREKLKSKLAEYGY